MSMPSKQGPSSQQQTQLPAYAQQAQQHLINTGQNLTGNFTGANPLYGVAGLNTDQLLAGDLTRRLALDTFNKGSIPAYDVFGMGKNWQSQVAGPSAMAAQLKPGDIQPFMNPYISASLNPTLDKLKQTYGDTQAKIGADAAASHMFGGSREAVARSLLNRDYMNTAAKTAGDMLSAGFDKASGLASGNVDRQQQANMKNADLTQSNNQLLFQSDQNDANRFLQALQLQSGLNGDQLSQKLQVLQALLGNGALIQGTQQRALDMPFKALQQLIASTPGLNNTGSTQTSSTSAPINPLSILTGIAGLASGNPLGMIGGGASLLGGGNYDTINFGG